jgi:hypothetical protein
MAGLAGTGLLAGGVWPVATLAGPGGVVQADKMNATAPMGASRLERANKLRLNKLRVNNIGVRMWVLMIEALVAFFLLVFIVWWTMYQGKGKSAGTKPAPPAQKQVGTEEEQTEKLK